MKGGGGRRRRRRVGVANGGLPTDLLVCFPTRAAHLTLMPKPICSPSRPPAASIDQTRSYRHHHQHHKLHNPSRVPLFRTNKAASKSQIGSDVSEPTSPKVTCAGQIKVRPRNGRNTAAAAATTPDSKNNNWLESVGIKKDVMNFLGTLRGLRFNIGCFGVFNAPIVCTSDDEDEEEEEEEEEEEVVSGSSQCRTIFSKWFMVLEESEGKLRDDDHDNDDHDEEEFAKEVEEEEKEEVELPPPPPKNALLLMRCRSAPAKRREEVERKEEEEEEGGDQEERLMMMSYAAPDFFKVSKDIAKETWLVGSHDPMLARSRSWRR